MKLINTDILKHEYNYKTNDLFVHGCWKNAWTNTDKDMECSECNFIYKKNDYFKFCPNCGAKMDKENKEYTKSHSPIIEIKCKCPQCETILNKYQKYCHSCGNLINWNGEINE